MRQVPSYVQTPAEGEEKKIIHTLSLSCKSLCVFSLEEAQPQLLPLLQHLMRSLRPVTSSPKLFYSCLGCSDS